MNAVQDPVILALNDVVSSESAAATVTRTLRRVMQQLEASAERGDWEAAGELMLALALRRAITPEVRLAAGN